MRHVLHQRCDREFGSTKNHNKCVILRTIACAFALLSVGCASSETAGCLKYDPTVVTLRGTLIRRTYPGPPNYENIQKGDGKETFWLLRLDSHICVDEDRVTPELNPRQQNVRTVELVLTPEMYRHPNKSLIGKHVTATGTLFGAITGHHHTPVLLTVKTLEQSD